MIKDLQKFINYLKEKYPEMYSKLLHADTQPFRHSPSLSYPGIIDLNNPFITRERIKDRDEYERIILEYAKTEK